MNLTTKFANIELRNPLIVASCGLSSSPRQVLEMEKAGAAAVVLKSLFEESILRETAYLNSTSDHGEAADYMQGYMRAEKLREYAQLIRECKACCSIPIFASICCHSRGEWIAFAREIERAGADALELNIMGLCSQREYTDGDYEHRHCEIVGEVSRLVDIPIIVKLGANLTNPVNLTGRLQGWGASGVVMFNRPYQTDINIEHMSYSSGEVLSNNSSLANSLRWVGLTSAAIENFPLALSGGINSGADIVKSLLAGASAVEVCSVLYREGCGWIGSALKSVEEWSARHGFYSVSEFCGRMNAARSEHAERLERMQFLKYFESVDTI